MIYYIILSVYYTLHWQDELEEDVQKEVDKVLAELTLDTGAKMANLGRNEDIFYET